MSISVSSNACTHFKYTKNLQTNTPWDVPTLLTPSPSVSGTSMSSKTPGGDLEDKRSLDRLFLNQSSSNLQETFLGMLQPFWHHLQVSQEHPCPPRLQEETWRTGGVLTGFFSTNRCQTCRKLSLRCYNPSNTISKCLRNILVLQDSRRRLGGQEESWQAFSQPIVVKLAGNFPCDVTTLPTPSPSVSGTSLSSKTPGGDLEDRRSLDKLYVNQSSSKLQETFLGMYQPFQHHLQVSQEHPRLQSC